MNVGGINNRRADSVFQILGLGSPLFVLSLSLRAAVGPRQDPTLDVNISTTLEPRSDTTGIQIKASKSIPREKLRDIISHYIEEANTRRL